MISVPEVSHNAGIFRVAFADERVSLRFERAREDKYGNVTFEVIVFTDDPRVVEPTIHQARLNLVSTSAQSTFAKYVKEQSSLLEHLEWNRVVGKACRDVLRLHREGEPVISLAEHEITKEAEARVAYKGASFNPESQPVVAFAPGESAKSLIFGDLLGVLVATGRSHVGFDCKKGNVLLLDYESDPDEHRLRLDAVCQGLGLELPANFLYRYCHQALADDIEQIRRHVVDKEISFMVVDSASLACGGEPENADATIKYFTALRSLRIASTTIAHTPGASERDPLGSVFWTNLPRRAYRLTSTHRPGESTFVVRVTQRKVNWGTGIRPFGLEVSFEGSSVRFREADLSCIPELSDQGTSKDRIAAALRSGKLERSRHCQRDGPLGSHREDDVGAP